MKLVSLRHFIEGTAAAAAVISWYNPLFAAPEADGDGPWDLVALDAASARLFGMEPAEIGHVKIAGEMGAGEADLAKVKIHRITLDS